MKTLNLENVGNVLDARLTENRTIENVVTKSFMQTERYSNVSEKFQVIQPAMIGGVLSENGFKLVSLITGKAKHEDKKDFQRTIARYRELDAFEVDGLHLDLLYISNHMGRGRDRLILSFMRGVCANQWNTGKGFDAVYIRHSGNPIADLRDGIARILGQRSKLVQVIQKMQNVTLTAGQIETLARQYAEIRLDGVENVIDVDFKSLAKIHRQDDAKLDLFTVANVLQENVIRSRLKYRIKTVDSNGQTVERNQSTRVLRGSSVKLIDLNAKMFDVAMQYLNAA